MRSCFSVFKSSSVVHRINGPKKKNYMVLWVGTLTENRLTAIGTCARVVRQHQEEPHGLDEVARVKPNVKKINCLYVSVEIHLHVYDQVIFNKGAKITHWRQEYLPATVVRQLDIHVEKKNQQRSPLTLTTLHAKTNSKWILALNAKLKTMQDFQEKNV